MHKRIGVSPVPLVKSIDEYVPGQTFEQLVVSRLQPFFGRSIHEVCTAFLVSYKVDQPVIYRKLTKAILTAIFAEVFQG
ncbi:hypothetical protein [Parapedobacter soli]|uniref:hypothetical protein n=1 Tax=Parapedobacter soli TaxID=416955 RepID=UPI0021C7B8B7|nr:hypothetical protein [Parapedobacter soli]